MVEPQSLLEYAKLSMPTMLDPNVGDETSRCLIRFLVHVQFFFLLSRWPSKWSHLIAICPGKPFSILFIPVEYRVQPRVLKLPSNYAPRAHYIVQVVVIFFEWKLSECLVLLWSCHLVLFVELIEIISSFDMSALCPWIVWGKSDSLLCSGEQELFE